MAKRESIMKKPASNLKKDAKEQGRSARSASSQESARESAHDKAVRLRKEGREDGRSSVPGTFTPQKQREFLALYATGQFTVVRAAKKVGVSHVTVFNHRESDPEGFGKKFRAAKERMLDKVEDDIGMLACGGNLTAMFGLLRAHRSAVWRENVNVQATVQHTFTHAFVAAMDRSLGISRPAAQPAEATTH